MFLDNLGHWRWEKQDFTKHGTVAMYLIGECRCTRCKEHILAPDHIKDLPANYAGDYRDTPQHRRNLHKEPQPK